MPSSHPELEQELADIFRFGKSAVVNFFAPSFPPIANFAQRQISHSLGLGSSAQGVLAGIGWTKCIDPESFIPSTKKVAFEVTSLDSRGEIICIPHDSNPNRFEKI